MNNEDHWEEEKKKKYVYNCKINKNKKRCQKYFEGKINGVICIKKVEDFTVLQILQSLRRHFTKAKSASEFENRKKNTGLRAHLSTDQHAS